MDTTLADKINADNKEVQAELTTKFENTLKDLQTVQSIEFPRMEENLMKIVDTKLENKVEAIATDVANQVACKLKDVLTPQNCLSPMTRMPRHYPITQDGNNITKIPLGATEIPSDGNILASQQSGNHTTTTMLNVLNEI